MMFWSSDVCSCSGSATFSATVIELNNAPDWKRMPNRLRTELSFSSSSTARSSPNSLTVPESGVMEPIM